jgi:diguanylate cyclase (GGDEF)-like protein
MKYTGRVTLLLLSLTASIIEFSLGIDIEKSEIYFDLVAAALAWYVGGLYDQLKFLSFNDYLTKTYNRRYADQVIPKLLYKGKLNKRPITLFSVDINNFKSINDNYGHGTGDIALKKLSELLVNNIRKNDIVFRWGGDEFLIVTPNIGKEEAENLVHRINKAVENEMKQFNHTNLNLGISIGFAVFPEDGKTFDQLLTLADKKMYTIKGSNKYHKSL